MSHHPPVSRLLFVGVLTVVPLLTVSAQTTPPPRTPVGAAELFACLPPAIREWQLTQSQAKSTFSEWLKTEATREFTGPPPPLTPGSTTVGPPPKTKITIIDTGFYPAFCGVFQDFQPGPAEGGIEKLMVSSLPATRSAAADGSVQLQAFVARRFIVRIRIDHQPGKKPDDWLSAVNLAGLNALATKGNAKLPDPLPMFVIDELNPKRSRSYQMEFTTEEEVAMSAASSVPPVKP